MPGKPKAKIYNCATCGVEHVNKTPKKGSRFCSRACTGRYRFALFERTRPEQITFSGRTKVIADSIIVNEEYYDWLNIYKWRVSDTGYAVAQIAGYMSGRKTRMHRLLMNADSSQLVDHINRDKLYNRISNLRVLTKSQNALNSDRSDNAKLYTYDKSRDKWSVSRFHKHYGRYDTEEEAKAVAEIIRSGGTYQKPVVKPTHCKHGHELDEAYFASKPKRCKLCELENGRVRALRYYHKQKQLTIDSFHMKGKG